MIETTATWLYRLRLEHDRRQAAERASQPAQEPLPFGDHFLDDEGHYLLAHGTRVGLNRHADNDEDLCPPCQAFMNELIAAGYAKRLDTPGRSP